VVKVWSVTGHQSIKELGLVVDMKYLALLQVTLKSASSIKKNLACAATNNPVRCSTVRSMRNQNVMSSPTILDCRRDSQSQNAWQNGMASQG
jgi:hypothetical protein